MQKMKLNEIHAGFQVNDITTLSFLGITIYSLEHLVTKAKMIHIDKDSSNNVFAIGFQTLPEDSSGVAHVLEHTILCGSKKYPVRDPFFSMLKRSMKTFMNAFTAPDWTLYPFATQNKKDFHNLMGVYLDAVFFPRLAKNSFLQEGHRLSFSNPEDTNSDLQIDGVVYNEMSAALSNPSEVLYHKVYKELFPNTSYRHNSGGDVKIIPSLTHEQLLAFHKKYYHPTNACFYSYGNFPLQETLETVNQALTSFATPEKRYHVESQSKLTTPKKLQGSYILDQNEDDGKKCQVCISWLTADLIEQEEVLTLQFIALILLGHSSAPLYKALIESKLGKSLCDITGYDDDTAQTVFTIGLQGVANEDVDKVENFILNSLETIIEQGINEKEIESALHQIELQLRSTSETQFPYGLKVLLRIFGTWLNDGDVKKLLDIDGIIAQLTKNLANPNYITDKIKQYFLANNHRVTIQLVPSHTLAQEQLDEQKQKLDRIKANLTNEEKEKLTQIHFTLKKEQETTENSDCLPTLALQDIPTEIKINQPSIKSWNGTEVHFYEAATNGIFYANWIFYTTIPKELRLAMPFLTSILTEAGAGSYSYEEISQQTQLYTSGFSAGSKLVDLLNTAKEEYIEAFSLSSHSLRRNIPQLFKLAKLLIESPRFDEIEHIQTILQRQLHTLETSIASNGHSYALLSATRSFNLYNSIQEDEQGITQIHYLRTLAKLTKEELQAKLNELASLLQSILQKGQMTFIGIGSKEDFEQAKLALATLTNQPTKTGTAIPTREAEPMPLIKQEEAWLTTTAVSYVTQAFVAPTIAHQDAPILFVAIRLLQSCFLHSEIREKGGAYGGMATFNPNGGYLGLLSYRDPHIKRTLQVYEEAITWFTEANFTQQDCKEAILQTCSMLDKPMSIAGERLRDYWNEQRGYTKEKKEAFRKAILNCTKEQIQQVALTWFKNASTSVLTNKESFAKEQVNLEKKLV